MFISCLLLQRCLEKERITKEKFGSKSTEIIKNKPERMVASILFIGELILMIAAVNIAINCNIKGFELIVNILLAVLFPVPFLFFNKCSKEILKHGLKIP